VEALPAQPLVTVVTPSFNQARFIEETIRSVAEQDYPRIEHVVVDGGSTDGTIALLERHSGVRWVSEPDRGQSHAVNKGIGLAQGDVIGWLNADDAYLPGAVASAVAALQAQPEAGFVYGNYVDVDQDGSELHQNRTTAFDLRVQINSRNLVPQPAAFMRRAALERVGFLDEHYDFAMDFDLWIRLGRVFPAAYADEYWAAFRYHEASKSVAHIDRFWKEQRQISRKYGGKMLSGHLRAHLLRRHATLGRLYLRAASGARLLRARQFGELAARLRG
jgi:glycosyltransferase involved in cell wall biosynthesis